MNHEEAKEILISYRPNSGDAQDPVFAEALALAERDPELGEWFAREQEFDARMRGAVRALQPPADFHASPKVAKFPGAKSFSRSGMWLAALAACLVVGVGIFCLGRKDRIPLATLSAGMAPLVDRHQHEFEASPAKMDEVRRWFAERGAPSEFTVPRSLKEARGMGCEVVMVKDAKVSLLCFSNGHGGVAHLYVIHRDQLADAPGAKAGPVFRTEGPYAVAVWSDEKYTYLLAERGTEDSVRTIL